MSCFNFIIMKVNGADVSNLPYEEAVQLFLNTDEPILVEVRRRYFDEANKLNLTNQDTHKSPTLAVISSTNIPNLYDGLEFCRIADEHPSTLKKTDKQLLSTDAKKTNISSISCQTELSAFDIEPSESVFTKGGVHGDGRLYQRKRDQMDTFDGCLRTEFDIEEITLKKSQSAENLGFTINYSTEDLSGTESDSDECGKEDEGEFEGELLDDFSAHGCKIYVSHIVPNSLADRDGRLKQGDRILQINGQNVLEKVDPNKLLNENKCSVTILVSRYAYTGEDDFLDSAVYCDDKECPDDRHPSSACECEENTFSSKSSISQSEQKVCAPRTMTNIYPIIPIAADKVSDLFNHANIKAQLESVNKEISLLNSQISSLKLHKGSEEKESSPLKTANKPKPARTTVESQKKSKTVGGSKAEIDVEHIYETISEDTESDNFYCSPYEGVNDARVEQWLKSIGCTKTSNKTDAATSSRLQKYNSNFDDYDNSSSAYNTGGSCNSALLAPDQQSNAMLLCHQETRRCSSKKLSSKCKNVFHDLAANKTSYAENCKNSEVLLASSKRSATISATEATQSSIYANRRIRAVPSTPLPNSCNDYPTDLDSDGHSTLVAKSGVYRMCQYKAVDGCKDEDACQNMWKVKRRPDGSRYIVRRVVKTCTTTNQSTDDGKSQTMLEDSASASAIVYKRQSQQFKERRQAHKNTAILSKEKHHAQHWLV